MLDKSSSLFKGLRELPGDTHETIQRSPGARVWTDGPCQGKPERFALDEFDGYAAAEHCGGALEAAQSDVVFRVQDAINLGTARFEE